MAHSRPDCGNHPFVKGSSRNNATFCSEVQLLSLLLLLLLLSVTLDCCAHVFSSTAHTHHQPTRCGRKLCPAQHQWPGMLFCPGSPNPASTKCLDLIMSMSKPSSPNPNPTPKVRVTCRHPAVLPATQCFCFVCDVRASECKHWGNGKHLGFPMQTSSTAHHSPAQRSVTAA